jgi:hypothetical protein
MLLKIFPDKQSASVKIQNPALATIAENACLPAIVAETFGWKAISIECVVDAGETYTLSACSSGQKIVMLPHFSYGPSASQEIASAVIKELRVQGFFCEWRLFDQVSEFAYTSKITTFLRLNQDVREQFGQFGPNLRRKIRKSASNGISVKMGKSELLASFYHIYASNMHRLGSPALPRRWFVNLLDHYRDGEAVIWCAYIENKPVGCAFMMGYQGFYEACWVSSLQQYNKLYTTHGLYWQMIQYAIERKGTTFSFGRSSPGSGVHKYKQQWGGTDIPLVWNYSHRQSRNIRSFEFLPKLWKLMPFPLAKLLGPLIAGRFY